MTETGQAKNRKSVQTMLPALETFGFMALYLVPWLVVSAMVF